MPYLIAAVVIGVVLVILYISTLKSSYYARIFAPDHYREVVRWAGDALAKHPVGKPSASEGTAVVTTAGITLAYTSDARDGRREVHFSISQRGRHTTSAVGCRMMFLLIRLVHLNRCQAQMFKTQSSVHHVIFSLPEAESWTLAEVDSVVSDMDGFRHFPIASVKLG